MKCLSWRSFPSHDTITLMKSIYDAIIIGAGASGLVCAITAAKNSKKVLLIEKNSKVGRKILYTGNGRCNITNTSVVEDSRNPVHYHGKFPKFVIPALNQFSLADTTEFFSKLGLEFIVESDGRCFPSSNQAQSVVDVLREELERLNVEILLDTPVEEVSCANRFVVTAGGKDYQSKKLVIATGGKSYPKFGSSGDGYTFAKKLGHSLVETYPAYVPLTVDDPICKELQGLKLETEVRVFTEGKQVAINSGTLMFAHFGLSAPVVLELSRKISELLAQKKQVVLKVNLLPGVPREKLDNFLKERFARLHHKTLRNCFVGLLPQKLFPAMLNASKIDGDTNCAQVSKDIRSKIAELLSAYPFKVSGTQGFEEAHFTAGGVNVKEVNPNTMESKLHPGLFLCGEVLDIDGDCGGYNLQWAWSSGYVAGMNI